MTAPLRIGVLGAAKIVPMALVKPARSNPDVEIAAVAARDPQRAAAFAKKHGISTVHASYEALLADTSLDAIYNPLPNGLHGHWTMAALAAGHHVLCEKPFTANADEAELVADAAAASGLVVMEAFHWRYHPVAARMVEIMRSGELGELRHIETAMCFPNFKRGDIRWNPDLAGGTLMDAGCYAIHWARTLAGTEPEVTAATSLLRSPGIDRRTVVDLRFAGGATGRVTSSMWSRSILRLMARAEGSRGTLEVFNPIAPQAYSRMTVTADGTKRVEKVASDGSTYAYQLRAFVAAVRDGAPTLTPPAESVANMRVIDAAYRAAGLHPRSPSKVS
ncbi:MAG: oxidoreductase [Ilumatobacteraceae bacterium]|nr:oxidoreductase [Ilumatobacteraceae bacterium]